MKKLIVVIILMAVLLSTNVSYGISIHHNTTTNNNTTNNQGGQGGAGGNATATATGGNANQMQGQIQGQMQGQNQGQGQSQSSNNVNEGNKNKIDIQDNSVYTEINPTDLLNPTNHVPIADKLSSDELYISRSIFKLQRYEYTCKELTRFANPGRFLAILWPEWDNKYSIEVATFAKYKAKKCISVLPMATASAMGLTKIGEGQASAKDLSKNEHQVMAALAVRAAEAGAAVVVFKGFSKPLVKVDSFVIGGGGTQVGSPQSIFNGAAGIGASSSETVTRACVVAELYR